MLNIVNRLPTSLTILPTYKCTAACKHCCFGSNPNLEGMIELDHILSYISQASQLGIGQVVFSGGEAFLMGKNLHKALQHAKKLGLVTRLVSNGFWATSEKQAWRIISELKKSGLTELNLSTGDFHQEFVALKNIINGTIASLRLSLPITIMIESRDERKFTLKNLINDKTMQEILKDFDLSSKLHIIESPWISMDPTENVNAEKENILTKTNLHKRRGCESILTTMVVTPTETLGTCCGLTREQIPELDEGSLINFPMEDLVKKAFNDFLKIWIFTEGPEHIVAWAAEKDPTIQWEGRFSHICEVCRFMYHDPKVRKVIKNHYKEKMADVLMKYAVLAKFPLKVPQQC